jgi:DNA recombination protein RmuC
MSFAVLGNPNSLVMTLLVALFIVSLGLAVMLVRKYNEMVSLNQASEAADKLTAESIQLLRSKLDVAVTKASGYVEHNEEVKRMLSEATAAKERVSEQLGEMKVNYAALEANVQSERTSFAEQKRQFGETKDSLTKEFENLANRIFEDKGKSFTNTSQQSLDAMLKPFKDQIEGFQKRVNEVHDSSVRGSSELASEIKKVLDVGMKMSEEANNLSSTLKGDSQQRGAWGEAQLERTLEMSGLIVAEHYEKQSSFKSDDGKTKLTDYLVKLPDNKHIVIDSKVTMVAYDRAVNATTDELHAVAMKEHLHAIRKHIDDLASKDYTNLIGIQSPSFVLMFMPIEPAYIDALKANRDLFEYGYKKGIVLVSHTTLIPILRTVSNLWMIDRSNKEAREVSEKAGDIYNSVCMVAERIQKLGNTLNSANNHYNSTVRALTGNQGLYGKVERFNTLSTKVSKLLPTIDESHLEHETDRLTLAVEAIKDVEAVSNDIELS